jgi:hypothetical protein
MRRHRRFANLLGIFDLSSPAFFTRRS